jgi:Tripartite tricarboxylate transporter family receptor
MACNLAAILRACPGRTRSSRRLVATVAIEMDRRLASLAWRSAGLAVGSCSQSSIIWIPSLRCLLRLLADGHGSELAVCLRRGELPAVTATGKVPNVLDVNPSVPVKTDPELIAYAKTNPRKLSMGSGGLGSPQRVAGELFMMMTGVDLVHVPYRGGAPAIADLVGGQLQVMFDMMPEAIEHIRRASCVPWR